MIDIQAGDVVVCVDDSPSSMIAAGKLAGLKLNALYRVEYLTPIDRRGNRGAKLFGLPAAPGGWGYRLSRFRKLDKADEKFTTQIKAIRPIREDA